MALSDLTASAVVKAIEEFDQLGRDSFLRKYGFRRARRFVLQRGASHTTRRPSQAQRMDTCPGEQR